MNDEYFLLSKGAVKFHMFDGELLSTFYNKNNLDCENAICVGEKYMKEFVEDTIEELIKVINIIKLDLCNGKTYQTFGSTTNNVPRLYVYDYLSDRRDNQIEMTSVIWRKN